MGSGASRIFIYGADLISAHFFFFLYLATMSRDWLPVLQSRKDVYLTTSIVLSIATKRKEKLKQPCQPLQRSF